MNAIFTWKGKSGDLPPRNQIWMKKNPWFEEETLPRLRDEIGRALENK